MLAQFQANNSYKETKIQFLENLYQSSTNKLYCLFLQDAILTLDKLNANLQAEKPHIHTLCSSLHKLLRDLLIRFVLPTAFHAKKKLTEVPFQLKCSYKENEHVIICEPTREFTLKKDANHFNEIAG